MKSLVGHVRGLHTHLSHPSLVRGSVVRRDNDTLRAVNRLSLMAVKVCGATGIALNLQPFN
ncbi:hypothetical protein ACUNV4_22965 [Granulosicoccus sp. 3-233]|uniref:hypothetical protein n=1 Tax=Granulosicoccus sp. 3-233 TaxID=3417969 RepID=UPI003D35294F